MSGLEDHFAHLLRALAPDLPPPIREYQAVPGRRFRWDFAWPDRSLLVEIQGGTWSQGAHGRGAGIERDLEKHNLVQLLDYRVFYLTSSMIRKNPDRCVEIVQAAYYKDDEEGEA